MDILRTINTYLLKGATTVILTKQQITTTIWHYHANFSRISMRTAIPFDVQIQNTVKFLIIAKLSYVVQIYIKFFSTRPWKPNSEKSYRK